MVEFGAAAQSRERCRFQRSCLCIGRGWDCFWPFSQHVWYFLCWWVSKWSDTAANPVSLALIRLESSSAGVLLVLPGKESKDEEDSQKHPYPLFPPGLVCASQRCSSITLANTAHLFISRDSSNGSQTTNSEKWNPGSLNPPAATQCCIPAKSHPLPAPKTSFLERVNPTTKH